MKTKYWKAFCTKCGWKGSSKNCVSGQIADTGDYDDLRCPTCNTVVDDADELSAEARDSRL